MNIITRTGTSQYDGRTVKYLELLIDGDIHNFSIRRYSKNTVMSMYKNTDKNGTKITFKFPNDKFDVTYDPNNLMTNFGKHLSYSDLISIVYKWNQLLIENNFQRRIT